ncbi:unannotated protein [freshwater metagenome]|uniref:Unannotated protein n=1 Tax=freshwater metagenome TaxID=449393 RepID=A0A6J7AI31_9ZZZZ
MLATSITAMPLARSATEPTRGDFSQIINAARATIESKESAGCIPAIVTTPITISGKQALAQATPSLIPN